MPTTATVRRAGAPHKGKWVVQWRTPSMPASAFMLYPTKKAAEEAAKRYRKNPVITTRPTKVRVRVNGRIHPAVAKKVNGRVKIFVTPKVAAKIPARFKKKNASGRVTGTSGGSSYRSRTRDRASGKKRRTK